MILHRASFILISKRCDFARLFAFTTGGPFPEQATSLTARCSTCEWTAVVYRWFCLLTIQACLLRRSRGDQHSSSGNDQLRLRWVRSCWRFAGRTVSTRSLTITITTPRLRYLSRFGSAMLIPDISAVEADTDQWASSRSYRPQ
jgi:hypothetical protein